jgi:hypothetical protein
MLVGGRVKINYFVTVMKTPQLTMTVGGWYYVVKTKLCTYVTTKTMGYYVKGSIAQVSTV